MTLTVVCDYTQHSLLYSVMVLSYFRKTFLTLCHMNDQQFLKVRIIVDGPYKDVTSPLETHTVAHVL